MFVDSLGNRYRVRIAPMERRGALGVDGRLNAAVFETEEGEWVGRAPIYHNITLESLTRQELRRLLEEAIARG
ncbi:MAG TPA: hypothetical protein VGW38_12275 [Chloroflexota bacterium]|nr:hypothetical protein [Chloroflexota bacterium]